MQLSGHAFVSSAVGIAVRLLPGANAPDVVQLVMSCAKLNLRDVRLMANVMQRAQQLVAAQRREDQSRATTLTDKDRHNVVVMTAAAVAVLDMRQLAAEAVALVAAGRFKQQAQPHVPHLRRLYKVHSWLQQHQLLDGRGLTGLLTEAQLQRGAKEAATWDWDKQGV